MLTQATAETRTRTEEKSSRRLSKAKTVFHRCSIRG